MNRVINDLLTFKNLRKPCDRIIFQIRSATVACLHWENVLIFVEVLPLLLAQQS